MAITALRTVLYVDDDSDICDVVAISLRSIGGLQVWTAQSGEQAIDVAYERRPDLVLMDVMMPGLDGPSTLRRLREHALLATTPIVFLTAKVLPEEVKRFHALGAIGVIAKPFNPARLCEQLATLWERQPLEDSGSTGGIEPSSLLPSDDLLAIRFLQRSAGEVARLQTMIQRARDHDPTASRDIEMVAHSLHGTAAMFGYVNLSEMSGVLERLAECRGGAASVGPAAENTWLQQLTIEAARVAAEVETLCKIRPNTGAMFQ